MGFKKQLYLFYSLILLLTLNSLNSCGFSSCANCQKASNNEIEKIKDSIWLSQFGVFSTLASGKIYYGYVSNTGNTNYKLLSIAALDPAGGISNSVQVSALESATDVNYGSKLFFNVVANSNKSTAAILELQLKDSREQTKILRQLIRVSNRVESDAIMMLSEIGDQVTANGEFGFMVPVLIGKTHDEIKHSNGSFSSLVCDFPNPAKGTNCSYIFDGTTKSDATIALKLDGIVAGNIVTTKEENHRIKLGSYPQIIASHGAEITKLESSTDLVIFNAGNKVANQISYTSSDSNLIITPSSVNGCGVNLAVQGYCQIRVSLKPGTTGSKVAPIIISFSDGVNNNQVVTNLWYQSNSNGGGGGGSGGGNGGTSGSINIGEIGNNMPNAIIGGKTRYAEVVITNNGKKMLKNIRYVLSPASSDFTIIGALKNSNNSCEVSGSGSLNINENCNLYVKFTPKTEATQHIISLGVTAEYTDDLGALKTIQSQLGLPYSATKASPLIWEKLTGMESMEILSNNAESATVIYDLINPVAADEGISATLTESISFVVENNQRIMDLTTTPENAACVAGHKIIGGGSCRFNVKYGPTVQARNVTKVFLNSKYNLQGEIQTQKSSQFSVNAFPYGASFTFVTTVESEPETLQGDGSEQNPYFFITTSNNRLKLRHTITNIGNAPATIHYINALYPRLSPNFFSDDMEGVGSPGNCRPSFNVPFPITYNLNPGQSCWLLTTFPNKALFNYGTGIMDDGITHIKPERNTGMEKGIYVVSWADIHRPESKEHYFPIGDTVAWDRKYLLVSRSVERFHEESGEYFSRIHFQLESSIMIGGMRFPITFTPQGWAGLPGMDNWRGIPCQITAPVGAGSSCDARYANINPVEAEEFIKETNQFGKNTFTTLGEATNMNNINDRFGYATAVCSPVYPLPCLTF